MGISGKMEMPENRRGVAILFEYRFSTGFSGTCFMELVGETSMTIQESGKLLALLSELKKRNNQLFGLAALYDGNLKHILLSVFTANEFIYKAIYKVLDDTMPIMKPVKGDCRPAGSVGGSM